MTNGLFDSYKELILQAGGVNLTVDTIKVALVDTGTVAPDLATHDFYDDISSAVVGTPVQITTPTVTDGVFDGDDVTFTSVSGASVEALVIYKDTGVAATSNLIALIDTGVTGLPFTPSGSNVSLAWPAAGIFEIP